MEEQLIFETLKKFIPKENIRKNEPMSKHTSFKTGGPAEYYIIAKTIKNIQNIIEFAKKNKISIYIIGNGSNLLISDSGVKGIILKKEEEGNIVIVHAGAGVKTMALAQYLKKKSISGFEELAGIPGTLGGANYMNAGAYGKEMKDILIETKVLNIETGNIEILKNDEQKLEYRGSIFKEKKYIILEVSLKLEKGNEEHIEKKMKDYLEKRKEKQPLEYPSAGSTFKRGENFITAKIIDECGLKGYRIGGAEISEKHAGFIINKNNATSKDILELIEYTKKKVFERKGLKIEEEVEKIGDFERTEF